VNDKKKRIKRPNFDELQTWLSSLGLINPTLHVNGPHHSGAVLAVDFGTPLIEQRLESEQSADLVTRLRAATRTLFPDKDLNIRIQNDPANGIWWSSVG